MAAACAVASLAAARILLSSMRSTVETSAQPAWSVTSVRHCPPSHYGTRMRGALAPMCHSRLKLATLSAAHLAAAGGGGRGGRGGAVGEQLREAGLQRGAAGLELPRAARLR